MDANVQCNTSVEASPGNSVPVFFAGATHIEVRPELDIVPAVVDLMLGISM